MKILDRPLPFVIRGVLVLLCALIPAAYVAKQYQKRHDLTQMILFGQAFQTRALPEIRQMNPEIDSPAGYDGQFYAQFALDLALRRPDLPPAIDNANLRGQRIVLPALAYVMGWGRPTAVIFAYALLNLLFWYVLFTALLWRLDKWSTRSLLIVFIITLTTGALISIQRALTDLPAATFGFLSLGAGETSAAFLISIATLTKPTSGLFLLRYVSPLPRTVRDWGKLTRPIMLALIPPLFWLFYLHHEIHGQLTDGDNFTFPFKAWWCRAVTSWQTLANSPYVFHYQEVTPWEWNLFEFLALMSITLQGAFLLLRPHPQNPLWTVGAGFAILFFCLNQGVYAEQISYTRTVLPLTIAFNLLLLENRRGPLFFLYLIAGNIGLLVQLHDMLGFLWRP